MLPRALAHTGVVLLLLSPVSAQRDLALISPEDISYLGAFKLEERWAPDYSTWEYSNAPLAYFPDGDRPGLQDGFPGSLFIAGHVYSSKVAELDIPLPRKSRTPQTLNTARVLQPMANITATVREKNGFIMGMTYVPSRGRIYFTHGSDYSDGDCDPSNSPPGLGSFRPTLSQPDTEGLWFLSAGRTTLHPFTSLRYIMEIPQGWADENLGGLSLATGRHRGWCPEGTNLYASAPWTTRATTIPARTLMQFGNFEDRARWSKEHSSANAYQGAAWLTAGQRSAAVITGIVDFNPARSYYGYADWKTATQCDPNPEARGCTGGRGWRAADPRAAFLFFRPRDLADVAAGRMQPWQVQWYARLDVSPFMLRTYGPTMLTTGAEAEDLSATFDRARGLLYVSESFADGAKPVIHVFKVG